MSNKLDNHCGLITNEKTIKIVFKDEQLSSISPFEAEGLFTLFCVLIICIFMYFIIDFVIVSNTQLISLCVCP